MRAEWIYSNEWIEQLCLSSCKKALVWGGEQVFCLNGRGGVLCARWTQRAFFVITFCARWIIVSGERNVCLYCIKNEFGGKRDAIDTHGFFSKYWLVWDQHYYAELYKQVYKWLSRCDLIFVPAPLTEVTMWIIFILTKPHKLIIAREETKSHTVTGLSWKMSPYKALIWLYLFQFLWYSIGKVVRVKIAGCCSCLAFCHAVSQHFQHQSPLHASPLDAKPFLRTNYAAQKLANWDFAHEIAIKNYLAQTIRPIENRRSTCGVNNSEYFQF